MHCARHHAGKTLRDNLEIEAAHARPGGLDRPKRHLTKGDGNKRTELMKPCQRNAFGNPRRKQGPRSRTESTSPTRTQTRVRRGFATRSKTHTKKTADPIAPVSCPLPTKGAPLPYRVYDGATLNLLSWGSNLFFLLFFYVLVGVLRVASLTHVYERIA